MGGLLLIFSTLSTLFATSLAEYCYSYSSSIYSSYTYSKFCPFGCCGTNYYQYCCVTNVGYVVGLVIGILFILAIIISVSCCCVRQRRLRTTQTTTVVSGVTPATVISTNVSNANAYPTVAYNANYGYNPDNGAQPAGTYSAYAYPVNQGYAPNMYNPSTQYGSKPQPPPNYDSNPPPVYSSPVSY